ncbi:MAG: cytidine/deoxycytidylate deaminase family protein [Candidatus Kerfeldbacteria bacterium]|nr:cytidine/deoxycytidylate deaminase family protein [Candidatus Kerfeldbacteria bacterium]
MKRPSWDDYFMAIARIVATRGTCDRLYAGAVLVKDKRIMSSGYNGSPPGLPHCDDVGHLLEEGHCVRTIHGEHNALLQAAVIGGGSTKGSTMYSVYSPCIHCAKYIAAAGVVRVVIGKMYRNAGVLEYLQNAGIETILYQPSEHWNDRVIDIFQADIEERKEKPITLTEEK